MKIRLPFKEPNRLKMSKNDQLNKFKQQFAWKKYTG
jgi:hypothetical protein